MGFVSNVGFVVTADGVVVFDALAIPTLVYTMLAGARRVIDKPVNRVVVSRNHADHAYGLQVFKAAGAKIWAHQHGTGYLASDEVGSPRSTRCSR
jgi:glyoxylase-like metal-dependent hydrolase (beta-lactamase superfamily II)